MASRPFEPTAAVGTLRRRARLLSEVRAFFDSRGFFEVQTPVLSADTVVDRHLDPVPVESASSDFGMSSARRMWLQTSPEFCMKRLLAAGADAIYQIGPAFRLAERGDLHNPEFTMLEWYRVGDDYDQGMQLLADFAQETLGRGAAKRITYREAMQTHAGIDPFEATVTQIQDWATERNVAWPASLPETELDDWLDLVMVHAVQPALGNDEPVILCDYPASQAALARVNSDDSRVAERFELFVDGLEIGNGYHELCDAEELLQRNRRVNQQRASDGKEKLPEYSALITAMDAGMPACSGVAVGFDRLTMLYTGASKIDDVLPFPIERA